MFTTRTKLINCCKFLSQNAVLVAEFSNGAGRIPNKKSFSSAKVRRISSSQKSQKTSSNVKPAEPSFLITPKIEDAWIEGRDVFIKTAEERILQYPGVWMRDNCQCPKCFDPSSQQRAILLKDFDPEVSPKDVSLKITNEKTLVEVEWSDGHLSSFEEDWLLDREFTGQKSLKRQLLAKGPKKKFWGSDYQIKRHAFTKVLGDDLSLYKWLRDLQDYGLTIVEGLPNELDSLFKLRDRVGCRRMTHYGDGFHVVTKPNPSNLAYAPQALGLHVDLPYYGYNPGTQFLHCLVADTVGGENDFADGFKVEAFMRENHPEEWRILSTTLVEFGDSGTDEGCMEGFYKAKYCPHFSHDEDGNVSHISFSNQVRDSHLTTLEPEQVLPFYRALKLFNSLCYSQENYKKVKLQPGECVVFDNLRVLHGRTHFDLIGPDGKREVHGGYVDWDEVKSKINILRKRLSEEGIHDMADLS